jgi:hypothetical protein
MYLLWFRTELPLRRLQDELLFLACHAGRFWGNFESAYYGVLGVERNLFCHFYILNIYKNYKGHVKT